ncbi:MAG: hypothetical protein ABI661_04270 [Gammaproteobacteria bacterium]
MDNSRSGNPTFTPGFAGTSDSALQSASSSAHAAVSSVAGAAEDAVRKAKPTIDRVAAMAHQAVDTAAGAAAPTADWLAAKGEDLKAAQQKLLDDTCSYVAANPLKSVGIAVVAGFVLSRIILR